MKHLIIKPFDDGCFDLDEGCETMYEDEWMKKLKITDPLPDSDSVEFTQIIMKMAEDHYVYMGDSSGEHVFSRNVFTIRF